LATVWGWTSPGKEEESIMHMLDWNTYRQQLVAGVGGLGKLNPDIVKGYTTLSRATARRPVTSMKRPANS
jgi:hypothetical protein